MSAYAIRTVNDGLVSEGWLVFLSLGKSMAGSLPDKGPTVSQRHCVVTIRVVSSRFLAAG